MMPETERILPNDIQQDPGFWKRLLVYFSMGLLWASTIFGLLFLPVIMQVGSQHSYFGERVDSQTWIYLYVIVALYTFVASIYLGVRGYDAKFKWILVINYALLLGFIVASAISIFLIFY